MVVHVDKLKPFYGKPPSTWLPERDRNLELPTVDWPVLAQDPNAEHEPEEPSENPDETADPELPPGRRTRRRPRLDG